MNITWNPKEGRYQLKGKEKVYYFDFQALQEIKKHISTRFERTPEQIDSFYNDSPKWLKKMIEVK